VGSESITSIIVIVLGLTELPRTQNIVYVIFLQRPDVCRCWKPLLLFGIFSVSVALQIAVTIFSITGTCRYIESINGNGNPIVERLSCKCSNSNPLLFHVTDLKTLPAAKLAALGGIQSSQPPTNWTLDREYWAIRNSAALIDVTPLMKYIIKGKDASRLLNRVITRDMDKLKVGQVYYTGWCDDQGKMIDDGTISPHRRGDVSHDLRRPVAALAFDEFSRT
jgi:hypothetical protein